jgi:hypothetical protein
VARRSRPHAQAGEGADERSVVDSGSTGITGICTEMRAYAHLRRGASAVAPQWWGPVARSSAELQGPGLRRPRESGDPVACSNGAFGRKTLGSRFRGNDEALLRERRSFAAGTTVLSRRSDGASPRERRSFAAGTTELCRRNDEAFAPANDGALPRNDRALPRERRSFANCHVVPAQAGTQWRSHASRGHPRSTHPFARSTAFCHPRRISATRSRDIAGSKRRSTRQLLVTSASLFQ